MFKKLTDDAKLPKRQTRYSSGFDVFANEDVVIGAGETKLIGLGIAIDSKFIYTNDSDDLDFMQTHYLELHIRSSLRVKGLTSHGTGIIDIDYPDEIKMVVHKPLRFNESNDIDIDEVYTINKGDKIGQLILNRHEGYLLPSEYTLDNERTSGFGSTGDK